MRSRFAIVTLCLLCTLLVSSQLSHRSIKRSRSAKPCREYGDGSLLA